MQLKGTYETSILCFKPVDSSVWTGAFSNDLSLITEKGMFGLIDKNGKVLVTPKYDRIFLPKENLSVVCCDNKYGVIDLEGREKIPPNLNFLADYSNGLSWFGNEEIHAAGLMNSKGGLLSIPEKAVIRKVNGQYLITNTKGHTIVNAEGQIILNSRFSDFYGAEGKSLFCINNDPWLLLDENINDAQKSREAEWNFFKNSEKTVPENLPFYFKENLAIVPKNIGGKILVGYIGIKGNTVIKPTFDEANHFVGGVACVMQGDNWGAINRKGEWIIEPTYNYLKNVNGQYFFIQKDNKKGLISLDGKVLLETQFENGDHLFGDIFQVNKGEGQWGGINITSGQVILDFTFDYITSLGDKLGMAVNFEYEEILQDSLDRTVQNVGQAIPREYKVKAHFTLFNHNSILEEFSSILSSIVSIHEPKIEQVKDLCIYKTIDDYFIIHDFVIKKEDGSKASHEEIKKITKLLNRTGLSLSKDQYTQKYGVINRGGENVLPQKFDEVELGNTGIIVRKGGGYGYFDFNGYEILEPSYNKIKETENGLLSQKINDFESVLVNKKGQTIK